MGVMECSRNSCKRILCDTYIDDCLSEIALCYFSSIKIDLSGIMYCPEHGKTEYIIKFDNNFNASQLD